MEEFEKYNNSCDDCKHLEEGNCSGQIELCNSFIDYRTESTVKICKSCGNKTFLVNDVYREELEEGDYGSCLVDVLDFVELECYNCGKKIRI